MLLAAELANSSCNKGLVSLNSLDQFLQASFILLRSLSDAAFARASYDDLKRMLNETGLSTPTTDKLRKMITIYEEYLYSKDNVYNSRSDRDIKVRDILRESTLQQLKDIAETDANAKGAFEVLFSNFLRED